MPLSLMFSFTNTTEKFSYELYLTSDEHQLGHLDRKGLKFQRNVISFSLFVGQGGFIMDLAEVL